MKIVVGNEHEGHTRRTPLAAAAVVALVSGAALGAVACQSESAPEATAEEPEFLFVQTSAGLTVDQAANTLRLVNVGQQALYFTDRPYRIAGHIKMADYLEEWTTGKDRFDEDPPNATLSVYEPGQTENTVAVVELTNPVPEGPDLIYTYRLIEGTMPEAGEATALFIDKIGPGGGVGVGYHGVGVGRRGPGVR